MGQPFYSRKVGTSPWILPGVHAPSVGWEVVQLVGLQILDLAILVRVQASQPNFSLTG